MSEDGLLSARNGSESVKKIKKYSNDTDSIKNKDYDADEVLRKKNNHAWSNKNIQKYQRHKKTKLWIRQNI